MTELTKSVTSVAWASRPAMTTVLEALAGVADQAVAQFAGERNGRVRGSRVVHAVQLARWLGEIRVPSPACHVGIGSFDLGALVATDDPVTCNRCLQAGAYRSHVTAAGPEQLTLWEQPARASSPGAEPDDECDQGAAGQLYRDDVNEDGSGQGEEEQPS